MVRQQKSKNRRVTAKKDDLTVHLGQEKQRRDGSPIIVPIVMFAGIILGMLVILANYTIINPASTWYLIGGLVSILIGIIASTMYR